MLRSSVTTLALTLTCKSRTLEANVDVGVSESQTTASLRLLTPFLNPQNTSELRRGFTTNLGGLLVASLRLTKQHIVRLRHRLQIFVIPAALRRTHHRGLLTTLTTLDRSVNVDTLASFTVLAFGLSW